MDAGYCESRRSAAESDSETEPNTPLTGIKSLSVAKLPSPPSPSPSLHQDARTQRPRVHSFAPAPISGHKLDDVELSPPPSLVGIEGDEDDWDFADTRDEGPVEESSEEWENIDSDVYDLASGTMQQIPSAVYSDENFRQTFTQLMDTYKERYTPSPDTKRKFHAAMDTLRFVGGFGLHCVKEPLTDWADTIAIKMLDMPLDEASSQLANELLSHFPETMESLAQELIKMNINPMEMDEPRPRDMPSKGKIENAVAGEASNMKQTLEEPAEPKSTPVQASIDSSVEERRALFKQEMAELIRDRAREDRRRAAQRGEPQKDTDLVNSTAKSSPSKSPQQARDQNKSPPKNLRPVSSPSNPSSEHHPLAPGLKPVIIRATTAGDVNTSRTAQVHPPKNHLRPQQTLPTNPSPGSRPALAKTRSVSRGRRKTIDARGFSTSVATNQALASEPVRPLTKSTRTTPTTETTPKAKIDSSAKKVEKLAKAVPRTVPSTFQLPSNQPTVSTRAQPTQPGSRSSAFHDFRWDPNSSPYEADSDDESDEEL
ncbi:hypothetical protein FKW77_003467 [Venturia effusa]|uniref:Uncharacterized protein n=1 Tax=Venturia effusa TaxID=50376 RepID=A0A517LGU9_9PEZI|nr:hypothetical protein FKW77_003467 [Venturia effusa]